MTRSTAFYALLALGISGLAALSVASCNSVLGISKAGEILTDPSQSATCDSYCATVVNNCSGTNATFIPVTDNTNICVQMCQNASWDFGNPGELVNNSLSCRASHAVLAAKGGIEAAVHCQAAGVGGGGTCGNATDVCSTFCTVDEQYCNGDEQTYGGSISDCTTDCAGYTYHTAAGASDIAEEEGDTLNCRIYHLQNAYLGGSNRTYHCPHTELVSTPCSNPDGG